MDDIMSFEFRDLLTTAKLFLGQGIKPPRDKAVSCAWSTNPTTGKLESHWVTAPKAELPEVVIHGIL
jgi:hypothetical protein